jgi:hypothetical protein
MAALIPEWEVIYSDRGSICKKPMTSESFTLEEKSLG